MEIRQVYYVLEVAKQKSFSGAAKVLYVTQPAISHQINALEEVKESIVLAREGKLIAIVVISNELSVDSRKALRLSILKSVNAQLPFYAQLYDIEWSEEPLARTSKQTIKRYLYK